MQPGITQSRTHFDEVIVELSYNCNFECIMCGFGRKPILPEHFMSAQVFRRVVDGIRGRVNRVRLNGRGESTIHPEFISMLRGFRQELPDVALSLFTNLSCREPVLEALVDQHVQLYISMDSPDPDELQAIRKGCQAKRFFANVERLATAEPRPFIVFTLQPGNAHRICDIAAFARSHSFGIIYNVVRTDEPDDALVDLVIERFPRIRADFLHVLGEYGGQPHRCQIPRALQGVELGMDAAARTPVAGAQCPAIGKELCIGFDGSVMPCNMFNPAVLGSILQSDLEQIVTGQSAQEFLAAHLSSDYCRNCAWMEAAS